MPKMHVSRSVNIAAPIEKIYSTLNDFHNWEAWSPWLIMEEGAKLNIDEDGKHYGWEGERIGSGNMTVLREEENKRIDYDLIFLKPWKSKAKTWFEFEQAGEEVKVTWTMDSSLPFFMFFMKKMFEGFVGMDYERGLSMLKELSETGAVLSKLDLKGEGSFDGFDYVGITTECDMDQLGTKMEGDLTELGKWVPENAEASAPPFTIYHKWDIVKKRVHYTSAVPVKEVPSDLPTKFKSGTMPNLRTYVVSHTGKYDHLGNAWSTVMNLQQNKAFKQNKKQHPFEVYVNDPSEVAEKDLVTEVHFPVK